MSFFKACARSRVGSIVAVATCLVVVLDMGRGPSAMARDLSIRIPEPAFADLPSLPTPSPFGTDGLPWPVTQTIVDGQTRFLTSGPAHARCPRDEIVFVPGVVDAFRSTVAGDGAFMCRTDAVLQGFIGR